MTHLEYTATCMVLVFKYIVRDDEPTIIDMSKNVTKLSEYAYTIGMGTIFASCLAKYRTIHVYKLYNTLTSKKLYGQRGKHLVGSL